MFRVSRKLFPVATEHVPVIGQLQAVRSVDFLDPKEKLLGRPAQPARSTARGIIHSSH